MATKRTQDAVKAAKSTLTNSTLHVVTYNAPSVAYVSVSAKRGTKKDATKKRDHDDDDEDANSEDGSRITSRVHCCIKHKTFDLVLGAANGSIDFRKARIGATLVYESSGDAVERKSGEPMEFDVLPSKDGRTAAVELRVNVLSSQLEGALFCVHFAVEPMAGTAQSGARYEVRTEPIRVVSKKSQLDAAGACKKRSRTTQVATREAVLEMIEKMDDQMASSQAAMQGLIGQNSAQAALMQSLLARLEAIHGDAGDHMTASPSHEPSAPPSPASVEAAFAALMAALQRAGGEGAARLTALGRTLDAPQWQLLAPLFSPAAAAAGAPPLPLPLDYDLHVMDHRVFLSGSAGNLFGLGGV